MRRHAKGFGMGLSFSHILIVLVVFVLLFGRGKISELMGDLAKGMRSFKANLKEDEPAAQNARHLELEAEKHAAPVHVREERKVG